MTRRLVRGLCAAWAVASALSLAMLIAARWVRSTPWSDAPSVDAIVRRLMVLDTQTFFWIWGYAHLELPTVLLAVAVAAAALHRRLPGLLLARADGRWRLTPLALALVLTAMLAVHYMFDVNPTVAAAGATSLPLVAILHGRGLGTRLPRWLVLAFWALFFAAWLFHAGDPFDRLALMAWAAVLFLTERWLAPSVRPREVALARALAILPINLLPALLPLVVTPPGATFVGTGLAYSFCEVPDRGTVFAALPVCGSILADYEACRDGRIVEYDLATKRVAATHRFFSPELYGRLELLVCLDDEVQVGVQQTVHQGRHLKQTALAFPVDAPERFTPVVAGPAVGVTIAYDAVHDALFYAGEFTNLLVRYDRRTKQFDDTASQDLIRPWHEPVTLEPFGNSLMLSPQGIHPGRNRLYVAELMKGQQAHAFDLTTLRRVATYDVGSGAGIGVSIDAERDRLFVSSLWGIEVFDLKTDTLLMRRRLGLGNRPVVVDAPRNRLYVSSMVEGKIRILDRDTLALLGQIPIGLGSRYPHLTRDGTTLFASSTTAHYAFDPDALVD